MMGYILLTLSGNGFKAQLKHLTAACFRQETGRDWRGCGFWDGYLCLGAPAQGAPLQRAGGHSPVTGTLSGSPEGNGVEAVYIYPPCHSGMFLSTQNQATPQMAEAWRCEHGCPPNKDVNSTDRKSHPPPPPMPVSVPLKIITCTRNIQGHFLLDDWGQPQIQVPPSSSIKHPKSTQPPTVPYLRFSPNLPFIWPEQDQAPQHSCIPSQSQPARPAVAGDGARPTKAWNGL